MNGAEIFIECLKKCGINTIFGVPGVNVLPLFDQCQVNADCKIVTCKNESGAAYMADGYARINGIGCCIGTTGPGISNMLTGIMASYYDSVPVIAVSAQIEEEEIGKYGIQEMSGYGRTPDMMGIMRQITKMTYKINHAEQIEKIIFEACRCALEGRKGPVYIEFSPRALLEYAELNYVVMCSSVNNYALKCDNGVIEKIINAVKTSKTPVMLIGNGCSENEIEYVYYISKALSIPIVSTALTKRLFVENENYLGCIGCYGNFKANTYFEKSDFILAIGVCFSYLTTAGWSFDIENKFLVRIDIEQEELNRNYIPTIAVETSAQNFLVQLSDYIREKEINLENKIVVSQLSEIDNEQHLTLDNPIQYIEAINEVSQRNVYYVIDVGQNAYWSERYLKVKQVNGLIMNGGMGAMGYGVAACIGVAEALKDQNKTAKTICICGDGGFLMNGLEVNTGKNCGSNVIWIVFENNTLGTQQAWAIDNDMKYDCHIYNADIAGCAKSMGIDAYRVDNCKNFKIELDKAMKSKNPTLICINLNENNRPVSFYCDGVVNINR